MTGPLDHDMAIRSREAFLGDQTKMKNVRRTRTSEFWLGCYGSPMYRNNPLEAHSLRSSILGLAVNRLSTDGATIKS